MPCLGGPLYPLYTRATQLRLQVRIVNTGTTSAGNGMQHSPVPSMVSRQVSRTLQEESSRKLYN